MALASQDLLYAFRGNPRLYYRSRGEKHFLFIEAGDGPKVRCFLSAIKPLPAPPAEYAAAAAAPSNIPTGPRGVQLFVGKVRQQSRSTIRGEQCHATDQSPLLHRSRI